jgi:hypothetical protein
MQGYPEMLCSLRSVDCASAATTFFEIGVSETSASVSVSGVQNTEKRMKGQTSFTFLKGNQAFARKQGYIVELAMIESL